MLPYQVHLWFAFDMQINNRELLTKYHGILNNKERDQQKRFHFLKDRHQYLITRALVRSVLSMYHYDIAPNEWRFTMNEYGRPFISNKTDRPLHFNLSHTNSLIVLAVSQNSAIGVDVELLERKIHGDVSQNVFTSGERGQLHALPACQHNERFYELWTLKESYTKALGKGLAMPWKQFSFHFCCPKKPKVVFNVENSEEGHAWQFWRIQPNKTHVVSLAVRTGTEYKNCYDVLMQRCEPLSTVRQVHYPIITRV